uniref:Cytochrome P450 n=1 Tax=Clytia hemisphaerica TaxID=252671 RepID=A0A7M5V1H2_9CNID
MKFTMILATILALCLVVNGGKSMKERFLKKIWYVRSKGFVSRYADVQEVPLVGGSPAENFARFKKRFRFFYSDFAQETNYTVYKVQLDTEKVVLADPVALSWLWNNQRLISKAEPGPFKLNSLRYVPASLASNGRMHERLRRNYYKIYRHAYKKYGLEWAFNDLKQKFAASFPVKGVKVPVERILDDISIGNFAHFMYGKDWTEFKVYDQYAKVLSIVFPPTDQDDAIINKMFEEVSDTPLIKDELNSVFGRGKCKEEATSEALFSVMCVGVPGLRKAMNSIVPLLVQLKPKDRNRINEEANTFFDATNSKSIDEKLKNAKTIEKFVLEMLRYVGGALGYVTYEANQDFIIPSYNGYYRIYKGQTLILHHFAAQRNPDTFRFPDEFTLTGNEEYLKENFFAFTGPYNMKATYSNRKCPGQDLAMNLVKMYVIHLARCDIVPDSDLSFNQLNGYRTESTDAPLTVKSFVCKK